MKILTIGDTTMLYDEVLTDEGNVNTTWCQWTAFCCPSQTVLQDPSVKVVLLLLRETKAGIGNALQDIVVVLGCPENRRRWVRHIPKSTQNKGYVDQNIRIQEGL